MFQSRGLVALTRVEVAPPGPAQLLVRAGTSLISTGTELTCLHGLYEPGSHWDRWVRYPFQPGYSMAGVVETAGEGATRFVVGDRVAARAPHRSRAVVEEVETIPIPAGVSDEEASWYGLATIAQNAVRRAAPVLGETAVVVGLGLVGQLVVQYLRLSGAREIFAVDTAPARLEMAARHGATRCFEGDAATVTAAVVHASGGTGCDLVFDATGAPAVFAQALALNREQGRLVLVGDSGYPSEQNLSGELITRGITVVGAHDSNAGFGAAVKGSWTNNAMGELFLEYLRRGEMRVADLITHRYRPAGAQDAYEMLRKSRESAMGVVFAWEAAQ